MPKFKLFTTNLPYKYLIALFLLLGMSVFLLSVKPVQAEDEKAIVVAPGRSNSDLNVQFHPSKSSYRIGEPINFRIKGDKTFYLYVYNIDKNTGDAVLLFPNRLHSGNKYPGGRYFTVPGEDVTFYSDSVGNERIVMIASARYIDVGRAKYKALGDFSATKSLDLENTLESKGIHIRRSNRPRNKKDVFVQEINLPITDESGRSGYPVPPSDGSSGGDSAIAFVSTSKDRYLEGERFPVVFGADQPGWVNVYVVEPNGGHSLLAKERVDGTRIYKVTAKGNPPFGRHRLIAVYSSDGSVDDYLLANASKEVQGKGVTFVSDERSPYGVRNFYIDPRR